MTFSQEDKDEYIRNYVAIYTYYLRDDIVTALANLDHVPDGNELTALLYTLAEQNLLNEQELPEDIMNNGN
ncbi:hypothetical protein [Citrobacter portucalensis]|uniref:hypothetical protein n=1 Tax=Citrobacter portucalensis TaxID=1639133 RepID=UPI00226BB846|nr:hypothetical protein [Citrobacter portucalensis]MCX9047068.1 hypothetical protein [Citrobacter portucalensis]